MKIFILNPLLFTGKLSKIARKRQPLELAYIASLLRHDHKVCLLDANALNLDLEDTITEIKNFNPEILILTSTPVDRWEVPSHEHIKLLIKNIIQTINSVEIPYIILTGAHGTVMPEYILQKTKVNFVVRGEPEIIVKNLVNEIAGHKNYKNILGISYLENNQVINNPNAERIKNLDELPLPAYDLLPMEKYSYTFSDIPKPFSIMLTSRGCPFNCTYCLKVMMPEFYTTRSPENVVNEIKYLMNKFSVQGIYFQDWEFLINKDRINKICDLILAEPILKNLKWGCNARVTDLDENIVAKMKSAGCVRINIGFESGSQKILDLADKKIKIEEIKNAIEICKKHNINIGIYSILNLPGETKETISETEKFLVDNNIKTMCAPNLPIPYPGTKLYEMLKKQKNREVAWEDLEKYTGRINVAQAPFIAKIYRWHYKYKYTLGNYYFLNPKFYQNIFKRLSSRAK
ncbi:hypothetical protein COX27_01820 [Candidatus Kuenenbacteria bacterium CG23_combo_of_CG06-09_8_20_14_all_36_9]|nr:MAG: hypothetical protein COX27_01820 [Candidatus Kuenenbacteria bacterium CG23_combo_of_CG06-09_8_20_14_all_36_9]